MGIRKARRAVLEETSLTDIFDLRLTASATMRTNINFLRLQFVVFGNNKPRKLIQGPHFPN